jgi:hypothetical protein
VSRQPERRTRHRVVAGWGQPRASRRQVCRDGGAVRSMRTSRHPGL